MRDKGNVMLLIQGIFEIIGDQLPDIHSGASKNICKVLERNFVIWVLQQSIGNQFLVIVACLPYAYLVLLQESIV